MKVLWRQLLSSGIALLVGGFATYAAAQEDGKSHSDMSSEEIAKELANPNASLGFLAFQLDYVSYKGDFPGASSQSAYKLNFQPSLPYKIDANTNFFVRPLIPVFVDQPVPVVSGSSVVPQAGSNSFSAAGFEFDSTGVELGDIGFDAALGKSYSNGMVLIGGVVATLDTATDDRVGLGQYLLGPEFFVGKGAKWGFVGVLLSHQWDVGGDDDFDTSITGGQYFFTYNLKNAWQIQTQPTFSYNHEAESGDRWTFPLGIGVSKTTRAGNTPLKLSLQYWHYIEQADAFGPDFQVRFQIAPVVPLPW